MARGRDFEAAIGAFPRGRSVEVALLDLLLDESELFHFLLGDQFPEPLQVGRDGDVGGFRFLVFEDHFTDVPRMAVGDVGMAGI